MARGPGPAPTRRAATGEIQIIRTKIWPPGGPQQNPIQPSPPTPTRKIIGAIPKITVAFHLVFFFEKQKKTGGGLFLEKPGALFLGKIPLGLASRKPLGLAFLERGLPPPPFPRKGCPVDGGPGSLPQLILHNRVSKKFLPGAGRKKKLKRGKKIRAPQRGRFFSRTLHGLDIGAQQMRKGAASRGKPRNCAAKPFRPKGPFPQKGKRGGETGQSFIGIQSNLSICG